MKISNNIITYNNMQKPLNIKKLNNNKSINNSKAINHNTNYNANISNQAILKNNKEKNLRYLKTIQKIATDYEIIKILNNNLIKEDSEIDSKNIINNLLNLNKELKSKELKQFNNFSKEYEKIINTLKTADIHDKNIFENINTGVLLSAKEVFNVYNNILNFVNKNHINLNNVIKDNIEKKVNPKDLNDVIKSLSQTGLLTMHSINNENLINLLK